MDVITDLMIISIPIWLLRNTQLRSTQKLRILAFLCLSVVMVAFAVARFAGGLMRDSSGVLTYSLVWTVLMLHIECSIAVLMGGVTAFRTVFSRQPHDEESQQKERHTSSLLQYVKRLISRSKTSSSSDRDDKMEQPIVISDRAVPTATLKGLRTFIRRNGRDPGHTTIDETLNSSAYDPLESYHNFKRHEQKYGGTVASSKGTISTDVSRSLSLYERNADHSRVVSTRSVQCRFCRHTTCCDGSILELHHCVTPHYKDRVAITV